MQRRHSAVRKQASTSRQIAIAAAMLVVAALAVGGEAGAERYGIGRVAGPADIHAVDRDIMPDGRGLPAGRGSVDTGRTIYAARCSHCHGADGVGGPHGSLAGEPFYAPAEMAADASLKRTVGNYWPHATSLFDYLRRAMPYNKPGSLNNEEVYAVSAYLLYLNGLVDASAVMDKATLPAVDMPARPFFKSARDMEDGS